jgi:hypothetical protein
MARGKDFSIPIPVGFHVKADDPVVASGGVALLGDKRPAPDEGFVSIIVVPVPPAEDSKADFTNPFECANAAKKMADGPHLTIDEVATVALPAGPACQFDALLPARPHLAVRIAMLRSPSTLWALFCNHDDRDKAATRSCDSALRGWRFDK